MGFMVFWLVAPSDVLVGYQWFGGPCYSPSTLKIDAA
jgi:hypothetical protein